MPEIRAWKHFSNDELKCKCGCNENLMQDGFMQEIEALRIAYGKPMTITSGYRCPDHPIEVIKSQPGPHTTGRAIDIAVDRKDAFDVLRMAFNMGFTGVGINQKGGGRFVHLDTVQRDSVALWSY